MWGTERHENVHIDTTITASSHNLKELIKESIREDIASGDFDVGYIQGTYVIRVHTKDDISEMWSDIRKQSVLQLCGVTALLKLVLSAANQVVKGSMLMNLMRNNPDAGCYRG